MAEVPLKKQPYRDFNAAKFFFYIAAFFIILLILFQIHTLQITPISYLIPIPSTPNVSFDQSYSLPIIQQWQKLVHNTSNCDSKTKDEENRYLIEMMKERLRESVTFLPLKDLRFAKRPMDGHTWFMSTLYDIQEDGGPQHQHFPSASSSGRLLCLKGHNPRDGSWNYYALAWRDALPKNATYMKGLTFVAYNHYDYGNIWHALSVAYPFFAWQHQYGCRSPDRWILYYWGEMKENMPKWLENLIWASFGKPPYIEVFDGIQETTPVCFEEAVVMRHNEGGMSNNRREETFDLMRCKARKFCNVSRSLERDVEVHGKRAPIIRLTLWLRVGARSFRNESLVVKIFENECLKVEGCRMKVAYPHNLTFCGQVKAMSETDIVVSPHGAQLANLFLMDRNSSIMEFFPKGWLKAAGVGQYVFLWLASWSGMRHEGYWHDPNGPNCEYPENDNRCLAIFKNRMLGYNETYFAEWAGRVLNDVKTRKMEEMQKDRSTTSTACFCS